MTSTTNTGAGATRPRKGQNSSIPTVRVGGLYTFDSKTPPYNASLPPLYVQMIVYTMNACPSHKAVQVSNIMS